jgi:hypothetical protein
MFRKKNKLWIFSLSLAALAVLIFIFYTNKKKQASKEQVVFADILKKDKNSMSASPWGSAYKKGEVAPLIQALNSELPKNVENFFQFSIHYFDVKEPINLSSADLQILIKETFRFLEKTKNINATARSRTRLFPFIKRLRGLGQDHILKEDLLKWTKKWSPKELHFIDALDVLVGISPFDEELLKTCLKVLKSAPDHETFEITQILQELKDPKARALFLTAIADHFSKASPQQQPLYFKILMQNSAQGTLDLAPKIQYALKQNSDLWVDAILTSVTFAKDPKIFKPYVEKISLDGSRPFFQHRAEALLKVIKL